ncbi:unnamed protein product [Nesidiocoris tenuis]|uniref:Uncharacterized protein n=1 Tax=Nesidiocoris tenuis TaxID=355587 RepID=A0A6H5GJF1_9HEMI|nr:unnamed protein product [Nesidiocoris tenuis]
MRAPRQPQRSYATAPASAQRLYRKSLLTNDLQFPAAIIPQVLSSSVRAALPLSRRAALPFPARRPITSGGEWISERGTSHVLRSRALS